ncbi:hypothetical protein MTO96_043928, partial [Rhipicephalus appendiculatus]
PSVEEYFSSANVRGFQHQVPSSFRGIDHPKAAGIATSSYARLRSLQGNDLRCIAETLRFNPCYDWSPFAKLPTNATWFLAVESGDWTAKTDDVGVLIYQK